MNESTKQILARKMVDAYEVSQKTLQQYEKVKETYNNDVTPTGRKKAVNRAAYEAVLNCLGIVEESFTEAREEYQKFLYAEEINDTKAIEARKAKVLEQFKHLANVTSKEIEMYAKAILDPRINEAAKRDFDENITELQVGRTVVLDLTSLVVVAVQYGIGSDVLEEGKKYRCHLFLHFGETGYLYGITVKVRIGEPELQQSRNGRLYFQYEFDISQDVRNNELNYPAYGSKADDIIAFETASRLVTVRLIKKFRDLIEEHGRKFNRNWQEELIEETKNYLASASK